MQATWGLVNSNLGPEKVMGMIAVILHDCLFCSWVAVFTLSIFLDEFLPELSTLWHAL